MLAESSTLGTPAASTVVLKEGLDWVVVTMLADAFGDGGAFAASGDSAKSVAARGGPSGTAFETMLADLAVVAGGTVPATVPDDDEADDGGWLAVACSASSILRPSSDIGTVLTPDGDPCALLPSSVTGSVMHHIYSHPSWASE